METASHYKRRKLRSLETFPERLRELRELRGLSRYRFVEVLRLNRACSARLETGVRTLSLATAVRIASVLDVTLEDLSQPAGTVLKAGKHSPLRLEARLFATNLMQRREQRGLSVGELAERSQVSYAVIHRAENEEGFPLFARVVRIAGVLGCTVDELLM
jgi:transcriptional regulator with XRE-family HTH domain